MKKRREAKGRADTGAPIWREAAKVNMLTSGNASSKRSIGPPGRYA